MRTIVYLAVWVLVASGQTESSDLLIVPGERVGLVTRTSTEESLLLAYGAAAAVGTVDAGEGNFERGLLIYNGDDTRRLAVVWDRKKPANPAAVFICYGRPDWAPCRWRTASGIGEGTTLMEIEGLNGGPFEMVKWGSDAGGNVVSFRGELWKKNCNHRRGSFGSR